MRLIDADALKESMRGEFIDNVEERIAIREIDDAPTIEIVRCKECKWADEYFCCKFTDYWNNADDFCSRGEREGE